jgi:hypothetical protein
MIVDSLIEVTVIEVQQMACAAFDLNTSHGGTRARFWILESRHDSRRLVKTHGCGIDFEAGTCLRKTVHVPPVVADPKVQTRKSRLGEMVGDKSR